MKSKQDREAEINIAKAYANTMLEQCNYYEASRAFANVAILIGQLQIEERFREDA